MVWQTAVIFKVTIERRSLYPQKVCYAALLRGLFNVINTPTTLKDELNEP